MKEDAVQNPLRDFVDKITRRDSDTVEKVLLHILDTSRRRWNEKASDLLHQIRDARGMDPETLESLKKEYRDAFNHVHRLSQMRYGVTRRKIRS